MAKIAPVRSGAQGHQHAPRMVTSRVQLGQHDAHEVGGVLGAELFHDAGAMHLDGAGRDAELAAGLLVGLAVGDELQHFALARRELGEAAHLDRPAAAVDGRPDAHVLAQRFEHDAHQMLGIDRLGDDVGRTAFMARTAASTIGRFSSMNTGMPMRMP